MNFSIASAILIAAFVAGWYVNGIRHDREAQKMEIAHQAAVLDARTENDKLKQRLEEDRAKTNAALNVLLDTPAPRVRLTICPPTREAFTTGVGSAVPATTAERTNDRNQEIFDDATKRLDAKAAEWSRALNECKVMQDWLRANPP